MNMLENNNQKTEYRVLSIDELNESISTIEHDKKIHFAKAVIMGVVMLIATVTKTSNDIVEKILHILAVISFNGIYGVYKFISCCDEQEELVAKRNALIVQKEIETLVEDKVKTL